MNSEKRTIEISHDNVKCSIEEFLHRMKLIDDSETVVSFGWNIKDLTKVEVKLSKEVLS